jgi:hypothetical protein
MPILESNGQRTATLRLVVATGLGAIFGLQNWRLARYGLAISGPWYWSASMIFSHVMLGFSVYVTPGSTRWWKRGLALGAAFGIPLALGTRALGLRWVPCCFAVMVATLVAGLLIALVLDALFPRTRTATYGRTAVSEDTERTQQQCPANTIRQRLAEGKACLEWLDGEQDRRGDPGFEKATVNRIVWRELLDLELQDVDDQLHRICDAAGDATERNPRGCLNSNKNPRKGVSHERNDS